MENIADYTVRTWGEEQAERYLRQLEDCCKLLAENPGLGRSCDEIRSGLHRMEHAKHVLFYRVAPGGVLVCRILHEGTLPEKQTIDDKEPL